MVEIYERPGPPDPPAEDEDWPHEDGIPDDDVKSAIAAIKHARQFWDKYEDPTSRKAKQKEKFYTLLDGHIARLEDVWEAVASYNADNFSYTSRKSTMDAKLRDPELLSLWEELIAEQEAKDENDDTMEPLHKVEQKLRRIALTGIQVGYLTKKHGKKEKASYGPDVRKPVYVSWSKDQKPLYRTYTGMLVRQPDMVWLPNATVFAAEKEAKIRWRDVRGVLTLYETKQLNKTELEWFLLNHAVRDVAIGYRKQLLPEHDTAATNQSWSIWQNRVDTNELWAAKLASLRKLTPKANSATAAYAAAYLEHYREYEPNLKTMRDCEVDKFIVQFLDARVLRPEAGTDDDLKLKPYKSPRDVGIFASN
ncbi:uncharacterized protein J4E88_003854 [Alternaria novae-zelandiae]|uniref:uncharacterized protein n=1 Tax=Alternaria novae-zelandiae TaxID=430562 RepID=UPI0020C1E67C|nr:uncharacterized protein J4E88_003854 [Alternaria novae-zelandiae]KAI4686017.1 hypothetical protein J4E88_003854 [Alternaria novae-zelandiae]